MEMLELVLKHADNTAYYQSKFPDWNGDHNDNVQCPFHKDGTASLSLNINGTGGAFCHGCDAKAGSIVHFEKLLAVGKIDDEAAAEIIYLGQMVNPIETDAVAIEKCIQLKQKRLIETPRVRELIRTELGLDDDQIESFGLGYDPQRKRVLIPIHDNWGHLVNFRRYLLPSMRFDPTVPKMINTSGHGSPPQLFPLLHINSLLSSKSRPLFLPWMAGERDAMLAWSMGIPCFTATVGESTIRPEWVQLIKSWGVRVGIVQDNDSEKDGKRIGQSAARKKLRELQENGIKAFIIPIPEPGEFKDFSDWALGTQAEAKDFFDIVAKAQQDSPTDPEELPPMDENEGPKPKPFPYILDPTKIKIDGTFTVADIRSRAELLNTTIKVHAIVSGTMTRTYSVPNIFHIGSSRYEIPISRELLQMVRVTDDWIKRYIKKTLKTKSKIIPVSYLTVIEVEIIPVIEPDVDTPYVNQRCFYIGKEIKANIPYSMSVVPTTLMATQETVGLITDIEPISNVLDNFELTDEICLELSKFQCNSRSPDGVFNHLAKQCDRVARKVTGITSRTDWHMSALLTWMSPLKFNFLNEGEQRGWVNTLALGDTETGKSKVSQKLRSLLSCGTFINSENCTFVGLVGGAVKSSGGQFMLRWGKIPLYHRQLVVIEELSGLSTTEISHMSEVRSSGVARLDKGGLSGETPAETRLLFLSNVRKRAGALGSSASGVHELQELIGQNEDIARFDLICTLVDSEVSNILINRDKSKDEDKPLQEEEVLRYRNLIKFIWSLTSDQIEITNGAYKACLDLTLELSKRYHASVPIFKAGSGRFKIARIACAIACSQFAWNEEKEKIVVEPRHIGAVKLLLTRLYDKASLGYARYSRQRFFLEEIRNEDRLKSTIRMSLRDAEVRASFYRIMSHSIAFSKFELTESLNIPSFFADRLIAGMLNSNVIQKADRSMPNGWELTPRGRKWIDVRNEAELITTTTK